MKVTVLLASGTEDGWEDVTEAHMDMGLAGALLIKGEDEQLFAMYAPSMWMRLTIES